MTKRTAEQALRDERTALLKKQVVLEKRSEQASLLARQWDGTMKALNAQIAALGDRIHATEAALRAIGADVPDEG